MREDSNSGSERGWGRSGPRGARESRRGDEEGRKDWGVRGVDGDSDSDRRKGSFCNDGSQSEEEGKGAGEISDGIARSNDSRKGKGRKQKRSNSVA